MVKDIKIVFSDPHHYPGSVVNGAVLVGIDKPKEYKEITVEIFGFASTRWSENTGSNEQSRYYQNIFKYVERTYLLWSKERAPSGNLPVGEHRFPFSMELPANAPPSFHSGNEQITYKVTARISPDKMLKFGHHVEAMLKVVSPIPTACMQPKAFDLDSNIKFCCCFDFGPVHINCNLPRTGFVLGETVPLNIQVENLSNKNVYIRACILKEEIYHALGSRRHFSRQNMSILRLQDIPRGTQADLKETSLSIPPSVPVSISNCTLIQVRYFVVIQAISSLGSTEKMMIPIVIANGSNISH